jgi:DNA-binding IclR family transcriptional regulator
VAAASSKPSLVRKTAAVLRAVAAGGDGIGLSEVARAASVPKATCLRILNDLIHEQLVVLDPDSKRYAVGFGALSLVGGVLDAESAHVHIRHELRRLADVTEETSGLDILVGADVVVIAQVQGPSTIGYSPSGVPRTLETWNTSTGKVLLAQLDTKQLRKTHRAALDAVAAARGSRVPAPRSSAPPRRACAELQSASSSSAPSTWAVSRVIRSIRGRSDDPRVAQPRRRRGRSGRTWRTHHRDALGQASR